MVFKLITVKHRLVKKPEIDQLSLFATEPKKFATDLYKRLLAEGAPFREFKGTTDKKVLKNDKELWFPFDMPAQWNGVLILA